MSRPKRGQTAAVASASLAISAESRSFLEASGPTLLHSQKKVVGQAVATNPAKLHPPSLGAGPIARPPHPGNSEVLGTPPLAFIENKGQFSDPVKFQTGGSGQTVWLTNGGIVFDFLRVKSNQSAVPLAEVHPERYNDLRTLDNPRIEKPAAREMGRYVICQDFVGANLDLAIETKGVQKGAYNYLTGSDPSKWQTQVRGFSEIVYDDVWNGVDLRLSGNGPNLEQEFVIKPRADASQVRLSYKGIEGLEVAKDGSLLIRTAHGQMRETAPRIYQEIAGRRMPVKGRFKLLSTTSYTFEVSHYNPEYALVIDPTLLYSTFLGGSAGNSPFTFNNEVATGIAVDTLGNAYVTGFTASKDFPTTPGAFQSSAGFNGTGLQTFVTKLDPTGSTLVYSTYLNAAFPVAISVDQIGNAYVAGRGAGGGFPTTPNAFSQSCGGGFLTVLNPSGSGLVYSTCFGADHTGNPNRPFVTSMAADTNGRAYIIGNVISSDSIPTTANAYQPAFPGSPSAFVTVLDTTASGASGLIYSTYLGLTFNDPNGVAGHAIAVDSFGKIYLTGFAADGFPVTPGAYQTMHSPCIPNGSICPASENAFIAKLDPSASGSQSLIYATYFGGMGETNTNAIAVDSSGAAYITGSTSGSHFGSFPVTPGAFQSTAGGTTTASFVTKLNAAGSQLVYSTFVSDRRGSVGNSIAVDSLGDAYIAGQVNGSTFPITPDAFQTTYIKPLCSTDCASAFLTKLNPAGSALIYSSYLGGSGDDVATAVAIDQTADAYLGGRTSSADFPTAQGAFQTMVHGTGDAFITKFPLGSAFRLLQILPSSGGNSGNVTASIVGSGFHAGVSAKLSGGGPDIVASSVTIEPNGLSIAATFNLQGAATGIRDVVVTNSDGTVITLPQAFTVLAGGPPNVQIQKVGTIAVPGRATQYTITVTNTGNVDSGSLAVGELVDPWFAFISSNPTPTSVAPLPYAFPPSASGGTGSYNAMPEWDIPFLPSHASRSITYGVGLSPIFPVGAPVSGTACFGSEEAWHHMHELEVACYTLSAATCAVNVPLCIGLIDACDTGAIADLNAELTCHDFQEITRASADPNGLTGSLGVGSPRWVSGQAPLVYAISFANEPTATAPVQRAIVTDGIDPNSDVNTVQLIGVSLLGIQVPISPMFLPAGGANEFATNLDLRPAQNQLISIDAKLDPVSRILTWTFESIDPNTGQPPLDASVGFLPPGGSGNVFFAVSPKPGLPTSSKISDQATIVFDANPPMSTQVWSDSIDNSAPISEVSALRPIEPPTGFTLSWSGTDIGSGIQEFTIFVSDNGGPFAPFQTNTTATSATFTGHIGHTYAFYSIARDLVGNVEAAKSVAETTTQVANDTTPPITAAFASHAANAAGWNNTNVAVTLNSTDSEPGGTGVKQIQWSLTGAQTGSTTVPGSTTTVTISTEGTTTLTYFGTDNAGNIETAKTIIIRLDKTPPTITDARSPAPNANGWNNTDVTISFTCVDSLSGLAAGSPPASTVLSAEGAGQSVNRTCTDIAGNSATSTVSGINIDKTPPVITASASPATLWPPDGKPVTVTVAGTMSDNLSGTNPSTVAFAVQDSYGLVQPIGPVSVARNGTYSFTIALEARRDGQDKNGRLYTIVVSAQDNAGNASSSVATVVVPHDQGN